jgi:hypothetical protein
MLFPFLVLLHLQFLILLNYLLVFLHEFIIAPLGDILLISDDCIPLSLPLFILLFQDGISFFQFFRVPFLILCRPSNNGRLRMLNVHVTLDGGLLDFLDAF